MNYLWELYYGGWVAPNIYYLGHAGVVKFGGIRIGGMSGIYNGGHYKQVRLRTTTAFTLCKVQCASPSCFCFAVQKGHSKSTWQHIYMTRLSSVVACNAAAYIALLARMQESILL